MCLGHVGERTSGERVRPAPEHHVSVHIATDEEIAVSEWAFGEAIVRAHQCRHRRTTVGLVDAQQLRTLHVPYVDEAPHIPGDQNLMGVRALACSWRGEAERGYAETVSKEGPPHGMARLWRWR
jgi:hypothetical protein